MTDRLDETVPEFAAASYPADDGLLAELRAQWPPAPPPGDANRGYQTADLGAREPAAALRFGDRYAVALIDAPGRSFDVVLLVRDELVVTSWRLADAGDGLSAFAAGVPMASERAIEADQTNASVVVGERAIVKWFRRVGPGQSRSATLLAHLDALGFHGIPAPLGSLAWRRSDGPDFMFAQGAAFLPGGRDGWEWCVERLAGHVAHGWTDCPAGCDPWIGPPLGHLTAGLHAALATPTSVIPDPASTAGSDDVARWRAQAVETLADALRLTAEQDPAAASVLTAIEPAMRADLDRLAVGRSVGVQPIHGDLHVGQVLEWSGGLAVIDFDGNPALGPEANAVRQPIERDVAQMVTSLDHVGRVVASRTNASAGPIIDAWIVRTCRDFLAALEHAPDPALLAAFEVEQECRELVYAARFLPRWRHAPLATLRARYVP